MSEDELRHLFAGGKIIGGNGEPAPQMPRSNTTILLRSTKIEVSAIVAEDMTVMHYQLTLIDIPNQTTYLYKFDDDIRNLLKEILDTMPMAGEKVEVDAE